MFSFFSIFRSKLLHVLAIYSWTYTIALLYVLAVDNYSAGDDGNTNNLAETTDKEEEDNLVYIWMNRKRSYT